MNITLIKATDTPLSVMGQVAGICYNQENSNRFRHIAERCLSEGHHRVTEYADVVVSISGVSAKVMREFYTHTVGVTKLQASTRYIDYAAGFSYLIPNSVKIRGAEQIWHEHMKATQAAMLKLKEVGVPLEDVTNLLPLAYDTTVVVKINLRALINMFHVRSCSCAYHEFVKLMAELKKLLRSIDPEWEYLADNYFVPKCEVSGFCNEVTRHCGRKPVRP